MKTDDRYVLGLDMGTSTVKAALFAPDGARVGLQAEEYLLTPDSQIVEADPEMYWSPVVRATRRLLEEFKGRPEQIAAVSTSTFGESIFPMAADKTPARPSISWLDNRSSEEARAITERTILISVMYANKRSNRPAARPISDRSGPPPSSYGWRAMNRRPSGVRPSSCSPTTICSSD